jgi:hypothetical protein
MSLLKRYKNRLYNGSLYPAIGFGSAWTSRDIQVEYSKYLSCCSFSTEFLIKSKLKNPLRPYRLEALCNIKEAGYKVIHFSSYMGDFNLKDKFPDQEVEFDPRIHEEYARYMNSVLPKDYFDIIIIRTENGDYIGDPKEAMWCINNGLTNVQNASNVEYGVCNIGYHEHTKKWVGWSHRASASFGLHDAEFNEDATVEDTFRLYGIQYSNIDVVPFNKRGFDICETDEECKQSAINFAQYIS